MNFELSAEEMQSNYNLKYLVDYLNEGYNVSSDEDEE